MAFYPLSSILLLFAAQQPLPSIYPDIPARALLTDSSPTEPGGRRAEPFDFQCLAGLGVRIDAVSPWDNMAFVIGPASRVLARDDDGGNANNARIAWTCPDNGRYRIAVASYHQGVFGAFELRVTTTHDPRAPRGLAMLRPDTVVRAELPPGSPQYLGHPIVYYGIRCNPDFILSIEMVSQFDNMLYLFGPAGMLEWKDDVDGTNAALIFQCRNSAVYRIGAAAREGRDAGPFRLHIRNMRGRAAN